MGNENHTRTRLISRMVKHGAKHVDRAQLFKEAQIVWQIRAGEEISNTCIHLEEFMSSAARNCKKALEVMNELDKSESTRDEHLMTALKKYVEDTCAALKEVDDTLRRQESSLSSLFYEIPGGTSESELSWRSLIGRRDVIAHQLLTVDSARVYNEAKRDFGFLHKLISRVYFSPVKTNIGADRGFSPLLKTDAIKQLKPSKHGSTPKIGESLIFVCEDIVDGFLSFRLGRSENNRALLSTPRSIRLSFFSLKDANQL